MNKKHHQIFLIILTVLFILLLCYVAHDYISERLRMRDLASIELGRYIGQQETVQNIMLMVDTCRVVDLSQKNVTIKIIGVHCFDGAK